MNIILEVEKPLLELEDKIKELKEVNLTGKIDLTNEIEALEKKADILKKSIYENLSPWDKVLMSRHPLRPNCLDYIKTIFTDFFELHGDRLFGDDPSMICGFAKLEERTVAVVGQQKGKDTKENIARNFGMVNPEGYRKSARVMNMAAKFGFPIITFVDTPGAYPGLEAEERGQFEAIARNILLMSQLPVPIITIIIGEGGSGGALAIAVGDKILMPENSIYSVISPEGCASILWRDSSKAAQAAAALALTAPDLLKLGIIDEIIPEPMGGAHADSEAVFITVKNIIIRHLKELSKLSHSKLLNSRYEKYRKMGVFSEAEN
ncbi:MAG: acetyl-CoA carboxylase carboxyltransferase subunit alpha [Firmicutes bacterium]|nr:acetyl-CoA carboxylase carboxyltransferase subunit alpha [Bacillota bacterium]